MLSVPVATKNSSFRPTVCLLFFSSPHFFSFGIRSGNGQLPPRAETLLAQAGGQLPSWRENKHIYKMTREPEGARGESPATMASEQGVDGETTAAAVVTDIGGENAALLLSSSILPPSAATEGGEDLEAIRREKR